MKESNHYKSRKYDKEIHRKRDDYETSDHTSYQYRDVLKEHSSKGTREHQKSNDRLKESHSKHSSRLKKSKSDRKSASPHLARKSHHKKSPVKSTSGSDGEQHKNRLHQAHINESYEELSRRKRRIESELHALDLEEAAARQAENKKARREIADNKRKDTEVVHIKEEPLSDEDVNPVRSNSRQDRSVNERKDKRKRHSSRSSADEKSWGKSQAESNKDNKVKEKEKPNFSVSGKLAEDTNTFNGVVIKYNEPAEARKPRRRWRLYPFKGDSDLPFIPIHRQSAYLFGRTRSIADIPIDHPSCSKQHAVLQFRLVSYKREDGTTGKRVRPYIIDLESSNGTFVNNKKITPR
ncbi:Smad nuclear interacting protein 1, partial [Stegodyphus mimosarum]